MIKRFFLGVLALSAILTVSADESRLLRFPNIHGDNIVFSYAGDLYSVNKQGGTARKLTSNIGYEMFPHFSPDGKHIAFTGQYDGNTEVFVMPAEGGEPRRLTYTATLGRDDLGDRMGPNNIVMDWTRDGKSVLFRTRQNTFNDFTGQLLTVPIDGGVPTEIPLKNGGFSTYSPDGKQLAYNYVFREFRTWKRYQGGMADDIRIFDFKTKESKKITNHVRQDVFPMWNQNGDEIYFLSDRDDVMNLYVYQLSTQQTKQLTFYKDYDIKFPSIGGDQIVYEYGGYIYRFDTKSKTASKVTVEINNDHEYSRPEWKDVSAQISSYSVAPNGERVLLTARGDVFSLPGKEGITYNLTNSSDANDQNALWSPDGKQLSYVSDKDGEFRIYVRNAATGEEKIVTKDIKTYIIDYSWSPNSQKILWSDKRNTLNITDRTTGKTTLVEESRVGLIDEFNWSPDSRFITYARPEKAMNNVIVYDVTDGEKHVITDGWYNSGTPNFSSDGKYLVFQSARTFNPTYSETEWNHVYNNMCKVYILPIKSDAKIPFTPVNDMIGQTAPPKEETPKKVDKEKKGSEKNADIISYSFQDAIELPIQAGYYRNLHMVGQKVYYNRGGSTFVYDLEKKAETDLGANIVFGNGYKKALAIKEQKMQVIDVPTAAVNINEPINLGDIRKLIDYHQEWMQIYNESWRQMRDFFYAPNMHGVDWNKVYEKYKALIPYVNHRTDLTYIIGEMIGELSIGHSYSQNGEHPTPTRIQMGLLGANFTKDASGYFKVESITAGANWDKSTRSPLTMPGVNVKKGDYIIAINEHSLKDVKDPQELLIGLAGKTTELTVNAIPSEKGARTVLVTPLADVAKLNYYNWIQENTRKVNEATNGEVGYIHIPDMGVDGLNEFVKHYYPQLMKKALIIDDRGNGGGNVSPMIIERLMRVPTFFTMHAGQKEGSVNPVGTFMGPKVLLINEYSASDGDLFPYRFKYNKLGTVIGKRTWGGVVGYSGTVPVVDGGSIVTPSYAPYAADGSGFIIEGRGVEPNIEIENDPYKEYMGEDQQLSKAIEVALDKLKTEKQEIPAIPAFPDKSQRNK
ncbi:S41 family peptidase [uncultured Bacteroides sp.]|uniref:S41 family peptidase n=1 Tax=uncultured Bacteroides sp. TaxID=162156 RepID=UPI002AABA2B4|nr:S41 family peptidase [uncultured Bacteroides sp.]